MRTVRFPLSDFANYVGDPRELNGALTVYYRTAPQAAAGFQYPAIPQAHTQNTGTLQYNGSGMDGAFWWKGCNDNQPRRIIREEMGNFWVIFEKRF